MSLWQPRPNSDRNAGWSDEILESLDAGAMPLTPIEELDQIATPPATVMVLQADPDFIGPMPLVAVLPKQSASEVVMPADPGFVGLREEEQSSAELRTPTIVLQADPDFIGPMPAVKSPVTIVEHTGLLPADPDFIGPMPDVPYRPGEVVTRWLRAFI